MGSNIEIKARVNDFSHLMVLAGRLSDTAEEILIQEDTFFNVPTGRLKLRVFSPTAGELIYYRREDVAGPKSSDYYISPTSSPESLKAVLTAAFGVKGVVRKTRHLFLAGQTRIHLDDVEGLGYFVELEVVLRPNQSPEEGMKTAKILMEKLGIRMDDLVKGAYLDLLERK